MLLTEQLYLDTVRPAVLVTASSHPSLVRENSPSQNVASKIGFKP